MRFTFKVTAEVERESGKFAGRDELAEQLVEALEQADPGVVEGEAEGVYNVIEWEIEEAAA